MKHTRTDQAARAGFTLMELIVVMAAIVLLLAVAVPSFASLIASQRRSLAQTQLQAAIGGARTLALQQLRGTDTAAVFTYEPGESGSGAGRLTIVMCVQVGSMPDMVAADPAMTIRRDVFVPDASVQPVSLPGGWMVRGLVTDNDTSSQWFAAAGGGRSDWVFPETGFYDQLSQLDGEDRQTFMVRFEGGTGRIKSDNTEALVLLRRPSTADRSGTTGASELFDAEDPARFLRGRMADTSFMSLDSGRTLTRAEMMGNVSSDTVLTRPVWAVALYQERELATALDLRVNQDTGALYDDTTSPSPIAKFDLDKASDWLETGDVTEATAFAEGTPGALLFTFNRADGSLVDLVEAGEEVGGAP